jgi:signal peptidase II
MTRPNRLALSAYAIALAVIVVDQALKWWVMDVYDLRAHLVEIANQTGDFNPSVPVLGPFHLSFVRNSGVSFGVLNIGAEWARWVLSLFSIAVAIALAVWVRRVEKPLLAVAVGLIMGGAVGNVIDRIRLGAVTDFLDFSRLWFPWVFNIADSAISIGAVLLIWDLFLAPRKGAPA